MMYYNAPTLAAPSYFDARAVASSATPLVFPEQEKRGAFRQKEASGKKYVSFDALLEENDTHALLAIDDGVIVYERYFDGFSRETRLPSFSISKTYAALLIGCAVEDELLRSADARLIDYVPSLSSKPSYAKIRLSQLLRMTSGIGYEEESLQTALLVVPESETVFVRFGEGYGDVSWPELFLGLARGLRADDGIKTTRAPG